MSDLEHLSRFERTLASGCEWSLSTPNWVVFEVSKGIAYARSSGTSKEVPTGGVVLSPPGSSVTILASQIGPATVRGVGLSLSSMTGFLTTLERQYFETQVAQRCAPFLLLLPAHPLAARLAAFCQPELSLNLQNRLGFAQVFSEVLSPFLREALAKGETGRQDVEARLREFLNHSPESELTELRLDRLAKYLNCCKRHASRLFADVCGCNFRSYISELRLKKACRLLDNPKLKIIDVAIESGHGCLAVFNYRFKKRFAMTPSEWRLRRAPREHEPARSRLWRRGAKAALALCSALLVFSNPTVLC
jgi:AraC-like DNA-binding protein